MLVGKRKLTIGIGEDDERRLAAKFEVDPLHGGCSRLHYRSTDGGAAGEGDSVNLGVVGQCRTSRLAITGNNVDHTRRDS